MQGTRHTSVWRLLRHGALAEHEKGLVVPAVPGLQATQKWWTGRSIRSIVEYPNLHDNLSKERWRKRRKFSRWRKRERARAGIEHTAAALGQPDCPGVSRSDHSAGFPKNVRRLLTVPTPVVVHPAWMSFLLWPVILSKCICNRVDTLKASGSGGILDFCWLGSVFQGNIQHFHRHWHCAVSVQEGDHHSHLQVWRQEKGRKLPADLWAAAAVSEILVKVVSIQFNEYFNEHKFLRSEQFTYCQGHFAEDAVTVVVNNVLFGCDAYLCTGLVYVDFVK